MKLRLPKLTCRRVAKILIIGLIGWLLSSGMVAWYATRRPHAMFAEPAPPVTWATVEEVGLNTSDGEQVGGWFARGDADKAAVVLLHGVRASRPQMLGVMQLLAENRYTVLAISMRAHGDSTGRINDFGWSARHDVTAAVGFLQQKVPGRPIFIVGRSMGAAAAIFAADELQTDVAGYFLEQPYRDLKSAVWHRMHSHLPPGLDLAAYAGLRLWTPVFMPVEVDRVSPLAHIGEIPAAVPIVFLAGSADYHAPLGEVRELVAAAGSHARLVLFADAVHENLDRRDPALYRDTLLEFLTGTK